MEYEIRDNHEILQFFTTQWNSYEKNLLSLETFVGSILSNKSFWERDLTQIPLLQEKTAHYLSLIEEHGMKEAIKMSFLIQNKE